MGQNGPCHYPHRRHVLFPVLLGECESHRAAGTVLFAFVVRDKLMNGRRDMQDRSNISNARVAGLQKQLHMTDKQVCGVRTPRSPHRFLTTLRFSSTVSPLR